MDHRDFANIEEKWHGNVDERNMTCEITIHDGDETTTYCGIPFKYGVCDCCNGKGKHVNPSIDGNGLTQEDFDQDFSENYFNGVYDVNCYKCGGSRVIVVYDESRANEKIKQIMKNHFEYIKEVNQMRRQDARTRYMENGGYY